MKTKLLSLALALTMLIGMVSVCGLALAEGTVTITSITMDAAAPMTQTLTLTNTGLPSGSYTFRVAKTSVNNGLGISPNGKNVLATTGYVSIGNITLDANGSGSVTVASTHTDYKNLVTANGAGFYTFCVMSGWNTVAYATVTAEEKQPDPGTETPDPAINKNATTQKFYAGASTGIVVGVENIPDGHGEWDYDILVLKKADAETYVANKNVRSTYKNDKRIGFSKIGTTSYGNFTVACSVPSNTAVGTYTVILGTPGYGVGDTFDFEVVSFGGVFVSPDGVDTNTGASGSPVKTLAKAVALLENGGVKGENRVIALTGSWNQKAFNTGFDMTTIVSSYKEPITFVGTNNDQVVYMGSNIVLAGPLTIDSIKINNTSGNYLIANGQNFTAGNCLNVTDGSIRIATGGIKKNTGSNVITLNNCTTAANGAGFSTIAVGPYAVDAGSGYTAGGADIIVRGTANKAVSLLFGVPANDGVSHTQMTLATINGDTNLIMENGTFAGKVDTNTHWMAPTVNGDVTIVLSNGMASDFTLADDWYTTKSGGATYAYFRGGFNIVKAPEGGFFSYTGTKGTYGFTTDKKYAYTSDANGVYCAANGQIALPAGKFTITCTDTAPTFTYASCTDGKGGKAVKFFKDYTFTSIADLPSCEQDGKALVGFVSEKGNTITVGSTVKAGDVLDAKYVDFDQSVGGDFSVIGASLRTATGQTTQALRFVAQKSNKLDEALQENVSDVTYGVLILPAIIPTTNNEELRADKAKYTYQGKQYSVLNIEGKRDFAELDDAVQFTGCVTNIPTTSYPMQYMVRAYVAYKGLNGDTLYSYSTPYITNIANVAKATLENELARSPRVITEAQIKELQGIATTVGAIYEGKAYDLRQKAIYLPDTLQAASGRQVYYVSRSSIATNKNNGKTIDKPKLWSGTIPTFTLNAGDVVLFERGYEYNVTSTMNMKSGISYGAYGSGTDPLFTGSTNRLSNISAKGSNHYTIPLAATEYVGDAGLLVLIKKDGTKVYGQKYNSLSSVTKNGDFYWNGSTVEFYWNGTPSNDFKDVRVGYYMNKQWMAGGENLSNVTIQNLDFAYTGAHAINFTNGSNITIEGCEIHDIGGCRMSNGDGTYQTTRFGNGIQFWLASSNIVVRNNFIYDIYDSAITHQGAGGNDSHLTIGNITIKENLTKRTGMGGIEYWHYNVDMAKGAVITYEGNYLYGASGFGYETRPDKDYCSAIRGVGYNNINIVVKNNIFDTSVLQLLNMQANAGVDYNPKLSGNTYIQTEGGSLGNYGTVNTADLLGDRFVKGVTDVIRDKWGDNTGKVIFK